MRSANAEASFTVTANKDIYAIGENLIIVGVVPHSNSASDYAILVKVTGPNGQDCFVQNILPSSDNSFVSRPVKLGRCGIGQYTISAFYNDWNTTSAFQVSNNTQTIAGDRLELRLIKNVMVQAQDMVNRRIQKLIAAGYVLPEDVALKYDDGASEASLVLQAVDFGDSAEAKKHMIIAIGHYRDVLNTLSSEHLTLSEQLISIDPRSGKIYETYNVVQAFYYRLQELAQKNQVDNKSDFAAVASLLVNSKIMIDNNDFDGAEKNLAQANDTLEKIRSELFQDGSNVKQVSSTTDTLNATAKTDEDARRLTDVADKFEKAALSLLNKTGSNAEAKTKVTEVLSLIASARDSISKQDYANARQSLSTAYATLNEAKSLIKENEDKENNNSNSTSGSNGSNKASIGNSTSSSSNGDGKGNGDKGSTGSSGSNNSGSGGSSNSSNQDQGASSSSDNHSSDSGSSSSNSTSGDRKQHH